ncbi:MAG: hypothetical protein IJK73_01010 [Bacteroidales bacterium]|nr:hypothetical protein [Bacteroidales bacterium]
MKRLFIILAIMTISCSLLAQNPYGRDYYDDNGRPLFPHDAPEFMLGQDYILWQPLDDVIGYSLYGSRYRKAKSSKSWGVFLCTVVAPASALALAEGIADELPGYIVLGAAGLGGSLGGGIPLWRKGRRELDWMLDDYARRYAPRPYSSTMSFGPTRSGIGLALNF